MESSILRIRPLLSLSLILFFSCQEVNEDNAEITGEVKFELISAEIANVDDGLFVILKGCFINNSEDSLHYFVRNNELGVFESPIQILSKSDSSLLAFNSLSGPAKHDLVPNSTDTAYFMQKRMRNDDVSFIKDILENGEIVYRGDTNSTNSVLHSLKCTRKDDFIIWNSIDTIRTR